MQRFLLLFIILPTFLQAQQMQEASIIDATNFIQNPAMTAPLEYWEAAALHRQQWVGFEDAPRTTSASYQHPFVDQNMSMGVFIQHDQVHPLQANSISFTYAYKLKFARQHQLSIGAVGSLTEYHINNGDIVTSDTNDSIIPGDGTSQMIPNAGLGIYYRSYTGGDFDETYYYAGIASNQLLSSDLMFQGEQEPANFRRALHGNAVFGMRIISGDLALEPSVWINYSNPKILDSNVRFKLEYFEKFWTGLGFSTSGNTTFQAGVILKNGFLKDGQLRIGTIVDYNFGTLGAYQGMGYGAYIAYRFENN